jgi:hypothetical protein
MIANTGVIQILENVMVDITGYGVLGKLDGVVKLVGLQRLGRLPDVEFQPCLGNENQGGLLGSGRAFVGKWSTGWWPSIYIIMIEAGRRGQCMAGLLLCDFVSWRPWRDTFSVIRSGSGADVRGVSVDPAALPRAW